MADPPPIATDPSDRQTEGGLSVAFVQPYGEHRDAYFPDTLLEILCARTRAAGHVGRMVRVYYDGHDAAGDATVRTRLSTWLDDHAPDLVVVERLFDPAPIVDYVAGDSRRRAVLVSWGDHDLVPGVSVVVGLTPGRLPRADSRRSPSAGELVAAFEGLLETLAGGRPVASVPGVAEIADGRVVAGPPPRALPLPEPYAPVLDADVIAVGAVPPRTRAYLFGNAGCPFGDDPAENPHYAGLSYPADLDVARLGCAFCHAGGDYQKRPDATVVAELVGQARYHLDHRPEVATLVLVDQHPMRYLDRLFAAAKAAGLRPVRWLFQARADAFVREADRVAAAIDAARGAGQRLELFLTGFESFCDAELARYNKGADVATLVRAVAAMRTLAARHPGTFAYDRARGHSLILWSPWTRPEEILETVENVRAHGLAELFDELGRNRLRLYRDLPVFHAAERDGALVPEWDAGDEGSARTKGYGVEHPWRFLDPRTRLTHDLAQALRARLGAETEIPQLAAAASHAASPAHPRPVEALLEDLEALDAPLSTLARGEAAAPRLGSERAAEVVLFGPCNNGCITCPNRERFQPEAREGVLDAVREARTSGLPVVLAGREPTLHPAFLELVAAARGDDGRGVGLVTNGRAFARPRFAEAARRAGLTRVSVKLFAPHAEAADAIARVPGGFDQACAGLEALGRAGLEALEIRAPLHRDNLSILPAYAALARSVGAHQVRVEAELDAVGLPRLAEAAAAVEALVAEATALGVALDASPLSAGTRLFGRLPRPSRPFATGATGVPHRRPR
jgi:pyruvate-formate lyase-activating enzyme